MALTHMQYDEIMREYEKKREVARHNAEEAKRTVEKAVPEYRDIEDKITEIAVECAGKALDGDEAEVARLKSEIASLTARQEQLLTENGFPVDHLKEKYECPDCKDTGYIDGVTKCHCLKQAILRYTYRQSNIEEILQRENFDTLRYDLYTDAECEKMKGIIAECRRFAGENGSWDIQKDIFTCDLLIIDDLGTENVNSFVASRLFDILNERDLRRKSTVISTNLSFEELGGRYTERNFSRIFGNYIILHPDVQDIRIRKRRAMC